ncbi:MAG: proteasome-activating nucleotidase [Candidatus Woesearchaeota archaeon]
MESKENKKENSVYYSYVANFSALEEENKLLRQSVDQLREELQRFKSNPLMVCEVVEVIDAKNAVIRIPNGNSFLVNVSSGCEKIKSGDSVLVEQKNLTIIRKTSTDKKFNVEQFVIVEKPEIKWSDVGGLQQQVDEIKEVIELPLKKPELFKKIGISPPKGVLLYGEPGTGKTLLAKAVASATKSTFIEVVGSELVQKFIGEGAKLVHEMFQMAREKAPSIIFIDEIDAIAATRIEVGTSGEREVQRTFMQLLAEIDGFDNLENVKIIGCTNRKDILDPAILRPGRLDRLIKVGIPNEKGRKEIFKIHTKRMKLQDVKVDKIVKLMDSFSGAEIHAVCTEAGYFAIRKNRTNITHNDFVSAIEKVKLEEMLEGEDYLRMFG